MVFTASGTIYVNRFAKVSGTSTVAQQTAAGAKCIGVSQEGGNAAPLPSNTADPVIAAESGQTLDIITGPVPGDWPQVLVGTGGLTANDNIMSDANGKGVLATTGLYVSGIALETCVAGELCHFMPAQFQLN